MMSYIVALNYITLFSIYRNFDTNEPKQGIVAFSMDFPRCGRETPAISLGFSKGQVKICRINFFHYLTVIHSQEINAEIIN